MGALAFLGRSSYWLKVVVLGVVVGFGFQFAQAWVAPTSTPPNGNIPLKQYVSDCTAYAANGWSSKNECLYDGRWHKVQSNDSGGAKPNSDLYSAVAAGASIKVVIPSNNYLPLGQAACGNIFTDFNGHIGCQDTARYSGGTSDATLQGSNVSEKNIGVAVYKTSGLVTCVGFGTPYDSYGWTNTYMNAGGCGPSVQVPIDWYVKY